MYNELKVKAISVINEIDYVCIVNYQVSYDMELLLLTKSIRTRKLKSILRLLKYVEAI